MTAFFKDARELDFGKIESQVAAKSREIEIRLDSRMETDTKYNF